MPAEVISGGPNFSGPEVSSCTGWITRIPVLPEFPQFIDKADTILYFY